MGQAKTTMNWASNLSDKQTKHQRNYNYLLVEVLLNHRIRKNKLGKIALANEPLSCQQRVRAIIDRLAEPEEGDFPHHQKNDEVLSLITQYKLEHHIKNQYK